MDYSPQNDPVILSSMNWFLPAILAPAVYAIVNFIDKYVLETKIPDYRALPIYIAIISFFTGLIFWIITGFPIINYRDATIVVFTGILSICSLVLYFKALTYEDTSAVILLMQMFPVISLVLSWIFLDEVIMLKQFIGFALILTAVLLISFKSQKKEKIFTPALFLIVLFDLLYAVSGVLMKLAINANSFAKILSYESWGIGIGGLLIYFLLPSFSTSFHKSIKTIRGKTLHILVADEVLFVVAKSLTFLAFSLGPVALVSVLEGSQVFFGILYGILLTLIAPSVFHEDITKQGLTKKIIASLILFAGILFVS